MLIHVVHALPHGSSAYGQDRDGLVAALEIVGREHQVRWLNVHPYNADHKQQRARIADADFVLVRSDWGWLPCTAADDALYGRPEVPVGLLIAGSSPAPAPALQHRFDVLFYETPWYAPFVSGHPFAVEAFGVDTAVMRDQHRTERTLDWLMVGRLAAFKRPERLLEVSGRRLAVGDLSAADPAVVSALRAGGVEVRDHVPYDALADLYNDARSVLVPCTLQGGGERAVLEARACGARVVVADDNPKLKSLLTGPVPTHDLYADQLLFAITAVVDGRRVPVQDKRAAQQVNRWNLWSDKVRRAPETVRIRARNVVNRVRPRR